MQIVPQILLSFKMLNIRLLALQCSKKLTNPTTHTFQKYICNVHYITTSGGKFNIFIWRQHGQKYYSEWPKRRILSEIFICGGARGGLAASPDPSPGREGYPLPTAIPLPTSHPSPPSSLLDPPLCPLQNSSQIYATASVDS